MNYDILLANIRSIISKTEVELVFNLREHMETMYWEIGFELKEFDKHIQEVIKNLSTDLQMDQAIFEISYNYYRNHPAHSFRRSK
jgi:hypothetical protein